MQCLVGCPCSWRCSDVLARGHAMMSVPSRRLVRAWAWPRLHTHIIHKCTHTHTHVCVRVYRHRHTPPLTSVFSSGQTQYVYIGTENAPGDIFSTERCSTRSRRRYVYVYICIYIYMYICMCVCIYNSRRLSNK